MRFIDRLLASAGATAPVAFPDEAAAKIATGPRPDEMPTEVTNG
jgi:hypothetical protein